MSKTIAIIGASRGLGLPLLISSNGYESMI